MAEDNDSEMAQSPEYGLARGSDKVMSKLARTIVITQAEARRHVGRTCRFVRPPTAILFYTIFILQDTAIL